MVESVGKKLSEARLQRGLTIDEAAHATKLRPDKIAALESDDYSRFANNIYAKGFLQIYGRFLKVDVDAFARTLDNSNPISVSDYQYLSNAPARRETAPARREERRPPSLAPLLFFVILIGLGLAGIWVFKNYERIQGTPASVSGTAVSEAPALVSPGPTPAISPATPAPATTRPVIAAPLSNPLPAMTTPVPTPRVTAATPPPLIAAPPPQLAATATAAPAADQDFVTPPPPAASDLTIRSSPPGGVNEVLVASVRKTWVTVRKDDPKAPPIFEDYVYPQANPLKLKGARFFIEARDPTSIQITKNGLPYAYQPTGVPVQ